jgi:aspartate aminotransferase-like enzyme
MLISGIVERVPMYRKMGFEPMGPAVPCGAASFVPMRMSLDSPSAEYLSRERLHKSRWHRNHALSLLPGPVELSAAVVNAFHQPPISHRSRMFLDLYAETRFRLGELMGGMNAVVLGGSGTLANDAVAANLSTAFGSAEGLVIANGEFGERLIRQARCAGLNFRELRFPWGKPWSFRAIEEALERAPSWIWAVHLETSTGVVNDLPRLIAMARENGVPMAADCVSSLGAVDTDAAGDGGLFLGSGVSGKALGSYAGLAFVFVSERAVEQLEGKTLCPTFDLTEAVRSAGPVSTVSSPMVSAVYEALRENYCGAAGRAARYEQYARLGRWTRSRLHEVGLVVLAAEEDAAPTVTTFPLPSKDFARRCLRAGFRIAHESDYLRTRAWGQVATMGNLRREQLEPFFAAHEVETHAETV